MIEPTSLFLSVLAVLNATLPAQEFPIEVAITPVLPQQEDQIIMSGTPEAATAEPTGQGTIDTITLGSIAAIIAGGVAAFRKNSGKVDAVADSTVNLSRSLESTDRGNADTAAIVARIAEKLQNVKSVEEIPQALSECAPAAKKNAEEWKQDIKEYYENKPPLTNDDVGLDKTRAKLVQVNQSTQKTPEP